MVSVGTATEKESAPNKQNNTHSLSQFMRVTGWCEIPHTPNRKLRDILFLAKGVGGCSRYLAESLSFEQKRHFSLIFLLPFLYIPPLLKGGLLSQKKKTQKKTCSFRANSFILEQNRIWKGCIFFYRLASLACRSITLKFSVRINPHWNNFRWNNLRWKKDIDDINYTI